MKVVSGRRIFKKMCAIKLRTLVYKRISFIAGRMRSRGT
jgi:hypothetical protein